MISDEIKAPPDDKCDLLKVSIIFNLIGGA